MVSATELFHVGYQSAILQETEETAVDYSGQTYYPK